MLLLPDEPMTSVMSSAPSGAWKLDGDPNQAVGFFCARFTYLATLGAGVGRSAAATPAPPQIVTTPDALFPTRQPLTAAWASGPSS